VFARALTVVAWIVLLDPLLAAAGGVVIHLPDAIKALPAGGGSRFGPRSGAVGGSELGRNGPSRVVQVILLTELFRGAGSTNGFGRCRGLHNGTLPLAFCFSAARGLDYLLDSPPAAPLKNKKKGGEAAMRL